MTNANCKRLSPLQPIKDYTTFFVEYTAKNGQKKAFNLKDCHTIEISKKTDGIFEAWKAVDDVITADL